MECSRSATGILQTLDKRHRVGESRFEVDGVIADDIDPVAVDEQDPAQPLAGQRGVDDDQPVHVGRLQGVEDRLEALVTW